MTDVVDDLEAAAAELEAAEAAVEDRGEARLKRIREATDDALSLLDEYEGSATGSGGENFRAYVEFQEEFATFVEKLDDDLPYLDAFEEALDTVDKRRLTADDFAAAREALAPAREATAVLGRRATAGKAYRDARRAAGKRQSELQDAIAERERLLELGNADLDAPVNELRDPIDAYNGAVENAFESFRAETPAREVLEFASTAQRFPLVSVPKPPDELRGYVHEQTAGEETIPQLLEYADYSRSKLAHYVDNPDELKRRVATHQTYLGRLDGSGLTIEWPPAGADALRIICDELIAVVSRFAPEDVVSQLRDVRALTRDNGRYRRLRNAAVAIEELGPDERERLRSGTIQAELESLHDDLIDVERALEAHPTR